MASQLYTPFVGEVMGGLAADMKKKQIGELAQGAYMGDEAAIGELYKLDPAQAQSIQKYQSDQSQRDLQNQRVQREEQRDITAQQREWAETNMNILQEDMEVIGSMDDYETAKVYAAERAEMLKKTFGEEFVPPMELTPERFAAAQQAAQAGFAKKGISSSTPREYEYTNPETGETYMARALVQNDARGNLQVKYVRDPQTNQPMKAMSGQSAEQAEDVAGARTRGSTLAEIDLADDVVIANMAAETKKELIPARQAATQTIGVVQQLREHPGRTSATGLGWLNPGKFVPGTDAHDFQILAQQAQGKVFTQAFAALRGGGTITDNETAKAGAAIARMETSQSQEEYLAALDEFEQATRDGYAKLLEMARITPKEFEALMRGELSEPLPETGQVNNGTLNNPAKPTSKAEYDALKSGAYYVKNGKTQRKK